MPVAAGGAPSPALVIAASVTAALVTAALSEALRRLYAAPPHAPPSTEELVALVLAVQAKAGAQPAGRALVLDGDRALEDAGSRESSPRGLRNSPPGLRSSPHASRGAHLSGSPATSFRSAGSPRGLQHSSSVGPAAARDGSTCSRGMQRSSSVGSQMEMHENEQQWARHTHTEDAVLRQVRGCHPTR